MACLSVTGPVRLHAKAGYPCAVQKYRHCQLLHLFKCIVHTVQCTGTVHRQYNILSVALGPNRTCRLRDSAPSIDIQQSEAIAPVSNLRG